MKVDRVGMSGKLLGQISQEYFEESGVRVEFEATEMDTSVRLTKTQQYLNSRSTGIDVFEIDVIWPGLIGDQLLDLTPSMKGSFADFLPSLIQNNTYTGRLVAIPYYVDFGLLYYRTDLLAKYGYEAPPATWAELEEMAARIQAGEREAGVADFHGFVFHGAAREGLTCAFLEWSASDGGGTMVEPDGTISINNPKAAAAIDRAARWMGTITSSDALSMDEEGARIAFQGGHAAFMRNWTYAYAYMNQGDSGVRGKFAVTQIPAGETGHRATLGGWQLAVSRYSTHTAEATRFALWMTDRKNQLRRAVEGGYAPTRPSLYASPELREAMPHFANVLPMLEQSCVRPSTVTGPSYPQISSATYSTVHRALKGEMTGAEAVAHLDKTYREILDQ